MSEVIAESGNVLPGFDGFNGEELDELIEAARRRKAELKAKELEELHQLASRVKAEASHLGVNLYTLLGLNSPTSEKGERRKICYRHPDRPYTWTGRGPKPGWIKELLAAGTSIESLMVDPVTLR